MRVTENYRYLKMPSGNQNGGKAGVIRKDRFAAQTKMLKKLELILEMDPCWWSLAYTQSFSDLHGVLDGHLHRTCQRIGV